MIRYLEDNRILHPSQYGFRSKHSTCTALLQMQDIWLEALNDNEISAVIMCDMSAAFDLVNHTLLLKKLQLYGFKESSLFWLKSYLDGRKQRVIVDGCLSDPLDLHTGVPQGSIIGPLLYICFTNDMPECVHEHHADELQTTDNSMFNIHCHSCGSISCYADDSTYSKSSQNAQMFKHDIDLKYKDIVEYINSNKLVINTDKTHLLVMCSRKSHDMHGNHGISLNTGSEIIHPTQHEKLLGGYISDDFTWNYFLRDGKESLYRTIVSRINILCKTSRFAPFKTRKTIANGIIMSKFIYLIQVWGLSCSGYLIRSLQLLQNRTARLVTGLDLFTSIDVLLQQCGWLSIHQLVIYHTLVLVYGIKLDKKA